MTYLPSCQVCNPRAWPPKALEIVIAQTGIQKTLTRHQALHKAVEGTELSPSTTTEPRAALQHEDSSHLVICPKITCVSLRFLENLNASSDATETVRLRTISGPSHSPSL